MNEHLTDVTDDANNASKREARDLVGYLNAPVVSQQRFGEALTRVIDIASKYPCSVSLIAIEICELDDNAHEHGAPTEEVLAFVGEAISAQLRNIDLIGYGPGYPGHAFTVITAPAFHVEGEQVAVRLCQSISTLAVEDIPQLNLTCGVSAYRSGDTPDSLFTRAKQALAQAKLRGSGSIASDGANESDLLL